MKKKGIFLALVLLAVLSSVWGLSFFRSYDFIVPIEFLNAYQIPCTSIEIEGSTYQVEIDLGSKIPLSLDKHVLEKIKKDPCGTSRWIDFRGNRYETLTYSIPEIRLGTFLLKKIKAKEESLHFAAENSIIIESKEHLNAGRIGRDFFSGKNIFMDFNHRIFIACGKLKDLEKRGYKTEDLAVVPFKITLDGIVLEIETDMGKRKFVLDTGSTVSAIRWEPLQESNKERLGIPVIETSKFSMGKIDFGFRELYLLDISQAFDGMDGLLGMDFLKEHLIYLDFAKSTAYVGKSQ